MKRDISRLGALTGVAFAVLLVVFRAIEAGSSLPDATDSTAKVVSFWTKHDGEQMAVAIIASFAAVLLVWFAGTLRGTLWEAEGGSGTLSTISFGGAVIAATGMLAITTVEFAAAHSAGDVPPQVTQTLSALQADTYFGVAAGFGIFGIAAGLVVLRTAVLPGWLGWVSVVSGVLWLTPLQFIAIFLSLIFITVSSVVLFRRAGQPQALAPSAPAAPVEGA